MLKLKSELLAFGVPINMKKSVLVPTPCINYLDHTVNIAQQSVNIPPSKIACLTQFAHLIADSPIISRRATARLKG